MYSKEQSARRPEKKKCSRSGCTGTPNSTGLCYRHRSKSGLAATRKKPTIKTPKNDKGIKKTKLNSQIKRSYIIEKTDSVFSLFIKLRDTDEHGNGTCISTGKPIFFRLTDEGYVSSNCDNGHYNRRDIISTRWDEINCNAQLMLNNRFSEDQHEQYAEGLSKKYSEKEVEVLLLKKQIDANLHTFEINEKYEHYKALIKKMIRNKEWWHGQRTIRSLHK